MEIRPIRTRADHKAALEEIAALMQADPKPRTPEGDRLDVLATLVEAYERKQFPIDPPEAIVKSAERDFTRLCRAEILPSPRTTASM